jgi:hypothetical protein
VLVHVVADYGEGDLAFAEVAQRLLARLPDAHVHATAVGAFDTLAAGFCVAQLALNAGAPGTVIYHNVAPRADDPDARRANAGERLAWALLPGGAQVVGVDAGYAFSFVAPEADELRWVDVPASGSQFRSRDLFPAAVAELARGRRDALGGPLGADDIPPVPDARIAYVDGYGNLKTTVRAADVAQPSGTAVAVDIAGRALDATVGGGSFEVEAGALAFAPGSSGWPLRGGGEVAWMELFLRGGSAWEAFGRPATDTPIDVRPVGL